MRFISLILNSGSVANRVGRGDPCGRPYRARGIYSFALRVLVPADYIMPLPYPTQNVIDP